MSINRYRAVAFVAAILILIGLAKLLDARSGLSIERIDADGTPATVFKPERGTPGPTILIAHGFAGSQQLMQPLAITLARSGYTAVTYDLLGHGRNSHPMTGSLSELDGATRALLDQLKALSGSTVVKNASTATAGTKIGVLGHSMASDIVVRFADDAPDVRATVALSMFSTAITPDKPPNLLVIVGALEPAVLKAEALRAVRMQASGEPEVSHTYGDFSNGTARRASFSEGVEHIGVLYSAESLKAARDWFNLAFDRTEIGFIDARGLWLALLFGGVVMLAFSLFQLMPVVSETLAGASLRFRSLLPLAIIPAIATPLLLWKAPTSFLPILLGDYLSLHFLLFGLLSLAGWLVIRRSSAQRTDEAGHRSSTRMPEHPLRLAPAVLATGLSLAYCLGIIGLALDTFVISFAPTAARLPIILTVFVCLLPYFLIEAWLTSGRTLSVAAAVLMKLCLLVSLGTAVALNLQKLFFLIIIIPAMLIVLAIFGLLSHWITRRTGHPAIGATMSAATIAYAIGVTFPMVLR